MNAMKKHVVSRTLDNPEWNNCEVIKDDAAGAVAKLKQGDGGPIFLMGSRSILHLLMPHGLVDEYRLMIFPVVLGSGRKLFPETPDKTVLSLVDTQTFPSGVVVNTYRPAAG